MKNIALGILAVTTAMGAVWGYQSSQRATSLEVLLADKNSTLAAMAAEKTDLLDKASKLQAEIDRLSKLEADRVAAEAALNAATVSEADTKEFGEPCRLWIAREFGDDDLPTYTEQMTQISDSWTKDGMLVFEVQTPSDIGKTSSNIYLCVVDKAKGSMFKPSAFDTPNWRKQR